MLDSSIIFKKKCLLYFQSSYLVYFNKLLNYLLSVINLIDDRENILFICISLETSYPCIPDVWSMVGLQ